ncbi:MAG TPA: recombinase family protein [Panacibacter sp.]|nr:recombinase family protein [Panacibacter sp.]
MNAVGYCRISTKDQSTYSLDYQRRLISEYCSRHKLTLLNIFTDDGESSYTFDRPDFKALETFIKKNKNIDYLIIFDHDRFSRNLAEALMKIKELQDRFGIKVLATTDPIDTDFSDPNTFMMRAFKYMMAESELHRIRQRTKRGIQQAALQGRHYNMAPYGYVNARDEEGKPILKIADEQAVIVKKIFKDFIAGNGIEEVRRMANAKGFKRTGNSAIKRILQNPVYAGLIKLPGTAKTIKGLHTAIISEQDYWYVQERLNGKINSTQNNEEVPLRGVLKCFCGNLVTAGNSRSKSGKYYWYYLCKEHKNNLPAKKLHDQFNGILETLTIDPETLEELRTKLSEKIAAFIAEKSDNISHIQKSLKSIKNKISATEEKFLTQPDISQQTYKKVISELRADESRLSNELLELNTNNELTWKRLNFVLSNLVNLRNAFGMLSLVKRQQFIKIVFGQNMYHDGKIYRTPFINELFADKELILKEKGLLLKDSPVKKIGETSMSSEDGS